MKKLRILAEKLLGAVVPAIRPSSEGGSVLTRLAVPHSFGPALRFGDALVAVVGTVTRIFGGCILFAVWGGVSVLALSAIGSRFWRAVAVLPLVAVFVAAMATLLLAVSRVERLLLSKR